MSASRAWTRQAVARIQADANRSADTHLHRLPMPRGWSVDVYLKDESVHPTGSLKHRLARSLFLHALCSGWIEEGTTIVEASSGSTAVSEAFFARLLGLPFVAVMPRSTSQEKIRLIELYGGRCHLVATAEEMCPEATRIAAAAGGHFMDQFTFAERATDWRGNNNIAESIFQQLEREPHPIPTWIVVGAGTGGTSATLGRYVRYRGADSRICVVDPEGSAFYQGWTSGRADVRAPGSRIEGIGRPRLEPSFLPSLIDHMIQVPDGASVATMRWCSDQLVRSVGASTGTALWGALTLAAQMQEAGQEGSIVTLIGDGGERYASTYARDEWLATQGIDVQPYLATLTQFAADGVWAPPEPSLLAETTLP